jgi:hypothetical protein
MIALVYIAGPFSAPTRAGVELNILGATGVGLTVAKLGAMPVIPHANTSHPAFENVQPYQFWIDGTLELARRCDAMLMVHGWERSKGAVAERELFIRLGKPVFTEAVDLKEWLAQREHEKCEREAIGL